MMTHSHTLPHQKKMEHQMASLTPPNFNPLLVTGRTFSHTFTEAGQYPYFSVLHPNMVGTVSVS
jgi:plastocyanin